MESDESERAGDDGDGHEHAQPAPTQEVVHAKHVHPLKLLLIAIGVQLLRWRRAVNLTEHLVLGVDVHFLIISRDTERLPCPRTFP
jgi:hypothetical protein